MTNRKKSHVFRVTGLPADQSDESLEASLRNTLNDELAPEERSHIQAKVTILPSCYEPDTRRVALVQFRGGMPEFLSELAADPLGDWQVEMGDTDINFDSHFFGFTQLYAPLREKPVVADIIAIAGLDGHAYGSWQGRGNLGRMWLRDFLSKDLPQCRTMIYGYNSKLSSHGIDTILDYGRELMEEIKQVRNTKECLVRAIQTMDNGHPAITSFHRATYGMILFAIPYKGLDSQSQRWRRTGAFITTVNADSALLQLPDHLEDKVPLHADHSMIIKFDTRDAAGYRTVLGKLRQFAEDAPRVVAARFAQARHRPPASSTVPFRRDPEFVGREGILDEIKKRHAALGQQHDRIALVGLAGLVYQWLCDLRNGHWLMVLDNADDDTMVFDADDPNSQGPLVKFLPQVAHGLILITSRNRLAAVSLVGNQSNIIDILPMDEEESLALLRIKIPISQQAVEDERALVQALEYIPLAIIQAGSYIASRTTRFTVARYLHLFQESESKQTHLLKQEDAKDLRRDPNIRHSVITTWQLSFEQIRHSHQVATELLALMSMFDRQGIPEYLVREDYETLQFEDALAPLISYSLIRSHTEERSFEMHRLVQLSVRVWLDIHKELDQWQEKSRRVIAQILPSGDYENWAQCQRLLPHAREVLKPSVQNDADGLNWASISDNCGLYLSWQGAFAEAEAMHRQALGIKKKVLGAEHPSTLASVDNLGLVLRDQGKYEEAEAMHRQALEGSKKVLGAEHPSTLTSVNNLGLVLGVQGKYEEAEAMHRQALETRKKVLGAEHPITLASFNNLGSVLGVQGKYEEAEAMHRQVLEGFKKMLGAEHPSTLGSVNNLGLVLRDQGKYEEAEVMHRQALEGSKKVLGAEHPSTLTSVDNLGLALETRKKVLGAEHPSTLTSVNNLGLVLRKQGKYEELEAMHRQTLERQTSSIGSIFADTVV
ncbi:hypothetical protein BDW68DRAFT_190372 [Aspergillus falconensis]